MAVMGFQCFFFELFIFCARMIAEHASNRKIGKKNKNLVKYPARSSKAQYCHDFDFHIRVCERHALIKFLDTSFHSFTSLVVEEHAAFRTWGLHSRNFYHVKDFPRLPHNYGSYHNMTFSIYSYTNSVWIGTVCVFLSPPLRKRQPKIPTFFFFFFLDKLGGGLIFLVPSG